VLEHVEEELSIPDANGDERAQAYIYPSQ